MGWTVVDFAVLRRNSQPAEQTDATLEISFPAPAGGQLWRVEQIAVLCTSSTPTALYVYDQTPPGPAPAGGTVKGDLTFATFDPPLTIRTGNQLVLQWKGASKGAIAYARVQFQILQGTAGALTPVSV
jgi:hypothetical protein